MGIVWKHNGKPVSGPDEIRSCPRTGAAYVQASYNKPIELQSMGFLAHPEDVAEHRKRFPNVELVMHQGSAVPVVRSLGQKRAYLKASGWADTRDYR
jgi:hypothetical protein